MMHHIASSSPRAHHMLRPLPECVIQANLLLAHVLGIQHWGRTWPEEVLGSHLLRIALQGGQHLVMYGSNRHTR